MGIGEILSKIHLVLRNLIDLDFHGIKIGSHTVFGYMIGMFLTVCMSLLMWRRWKKETKLLARFYLSLLIGFISSLPFYLFLLWIFKEERGILRVSGMVTMWTFAMGFSFLYLFLHHRKKIPDFYDHILPFFAFFIGWLKFFHCFIFGCCFGKPTSLPWGVVFHPESPAGIAYPSTPLHPVQIYNTIGAWVIIPPALWLLKRKHFDGEVSLWMFLYLGIMKTFEFPYFRGDTTSIFRIWIISIPVFVISFFALILLYYRYLSKKESVNSLPFR